MAELAGKWEDLGISLGVRLSDLDAIHLANTHSPSDCLKNMLKLWLRQSYKVGQYNYDEHTAFTLQSSCLIYFVCKVHFIDD